MPSYFNSRQKRKLDEMYDQLRNEFDSVKRSAIQPASNFYSRNEHDLFSNPPNIMDERETGRKGKPLVSIVRGYYFLVKCFMMYSKLVSIIFNQINET